MAVKKSTPKKKTAAKAKRASNANAQLLRVSDQFTPLAVGLTWIFVVLAFVFVSVAYWRYG